MFSAYFTEQMPTIYHEIATRYAPQCFLHEWLAGHAGT